MWPSAPRLGRHWSGVLATFNVTTTNDGGPGSLRKAIIDANALAGADDDHRAVRETTSCP